MQGLEAHKAVERPSQVSSLRESAFPRAAQEEGGLSRAQGAGAGHNASWLPLGRACCQFPRSVALCRPTGL